MNQRRFEEVCMPLTYSVRGQLPGQLFPIFLMLFLFIEPYDGLADAYLVLTPTSPPLVGGETEVKEMKTTLYSIVLYLIN